MGVYINGMEMPTSCTSCDIACWHYLDFGADGLLSKICRTESRRPDCPLVPVPPHGRLIDADALCMKLKMMYAKAFGEGNTAYHAAYRSLERVVSHEPTIIPASFENPPKNERYSQDNPAEEGET